jgi:phage terminase Nu1 subunit (DNA packaging protein)
MVEITAAPGHSDAPETSGAAPMSYAEARAMRESALAELAQLKLEAERGNSVSIDIVKRDWVLTLTDLRGRLLTIPARVAAASPHLSKADITMIGAEVRQALEELANADMA